MKLSNPRLSKSDTPSMSLWLALKERIQFRIDQFDVYVLESIRKYIKNLSNKKISEEVRGEKRKNVSIIVVNYNTLSLIAHAIYSIYDKIIYKDGKIRIIVVDNCSFDGSREFLEILDKNKFINLIKLNKHKYHAPALRIGINSIETFEKVLPEEDKTDKTGTLLTLDSDVIILSEDIISDSIKVLYSAENIALAGQMQYDVFVNKSGYPHPSCLLIKKEIYDLPHVKSFILTGSPATALVMSLIKNGWKILDFHFRDDNYILHIGRGTLKITKKYDLKKNVHYYWPTAGKGHHYHGNPDGKNIHRRELEKFRTHIKELSYPYDSYIDVLYNLKSRNNIAG